MISCPVSSAASVAPIMFLTTFGIALVVVWSVSGSVTSISQPICSPILPRPADTAAVSPPLANASRGSSPYKIACAAPTVPCVIACTATSLTPSLRASPITLSTNGAVC